jgi:putative flippase GtrA
MSKFVHLLRTPDARYAIGAAVSWPIYGALYIAMLKIFDRNYAAAASISWILSYGVVYAFQKYGTFGTMSRESMLREVGRYAVAVAGLSAAVNFAVVKVLANYFYVVQNCRGRGCGSRRRSRRVVRFDAHIAHWRPG